MDIRSTIRKLLALSNSSNENEAQSALTKAQELLAKYHLSMDEIKDADVDHNVIEETADRKAHRTPWKRRLGRVIGTNFKCGTFIRGYDTYETIFIGKRADIDVCKEVYTSALRFIDFYFKSFWHKTLMEKPWLNLADSISMKASYANGFIDALKNRFDEQKVQADQEGWGLVLVKDADVVNYMNTQYPNLAKSVSRCNRSDSNAYYQGHEDCSSKFGDTGVRKIKN